MKEEKNALDSIFYCNSFSMPDMRESEIVFHSHLWNVRIVFIYLKVNKLFNEIRY